MSQYVISVNLHTENKPVVTGLKIRPLVIGLKCGQELESVSTLSRLCFCSNLCTKATATRT